MDGKLLKYKKYAIISWVFIILAFLYLLMVLTKGVWVYTYEPTNKFSSTAFNWANSIIDKTYFFPINYLWDYIPNIAINDIDHKTLFIVFIPPLVIFLVAFLYIDTYRALKRNEYELNKEVTRKLAIRKKEQEAGLYENQNPETINIKIETKELKVIPWHNKWWGKIIIPLLVLMIATAVGLRTLG